MQLTMSASASPAAPAMMSQFIFMAIVHCHLVSKINDKKYPSGMQAPSIPAEVTMKVYLTIFSMIARHCCSA